jgi:hypothetical protein
MRFRVRYSGTVCAIGLAGCGAVRGSRPAGAAAVGPRGPPHPAEQPTSRSGLAKRRGGGYGWAVVMPEDLR